MIKLNIKKQLNRIKLDIQLEIKKGEFLALMGTSGSGKTTLLRSLAGLEKIEGSIKVGDNVWQDSSFCLEVQKREIGFVFQDYALFSNMSVEQNLLFVKKDRNLANYLLEVVELQDFKKQNVLTLSGGQKQRVALCRALMNSPKILLLDEPLSALHSEMRVKLQDEILKFHKEFGLTTIMVSHDPSEIYKLSSKVVVLDDGKIVNCGDYKEIFLKTKGSQKFSFEGVLLDIIKVDVINIAIISIGQQLVEVVISSSEVESLKIGEKVQVSTKAFAPNISIL